MGNTGQQNGCDRCSCDGFARVVKLRCTGIDGDDLYAVECMDCQMLGSARPNAMQSVIVWNMERRRDRKS